VPFTVQRIEYEEQVEQIPVRTCRYVSETKAVQVPRTVGKWVAYTSMRLQPRIVTMRVPLVPAVEAVVEAPAYVAPPAPAMPVVPPGTTSVRRLPTNGKINGTNGTTNGAKTNGSKAGSVDSSKTQPTPADASKKPSDKDETGQPRIEKKPEDDGPSVPNPNAEGNARRRGADLNA